MIGDTHSGERLCNDAGDNALEEESVSVVEDVKARREEEVEVQKPASAVFAVAVHKLRNGGKVVEVK